MSLVEVSMTTEPSMTVVKELLKMDDEKLLKAEKATVMGDPLLLIEGGYLTVRTKGGELKKLILNSVQKKLLKRIKEIKKSGKPVRLWVLKARQAGLCGSPNMRVLTSDLRWVRLRDIKEGQEIVATDECVKGNGKGKGRKLRTGYVISKSSIFETGYKLKMEDGRELVLTAGHKMLSKIRSPGGVRGRETQWRETKDFEVGDVIRYITDVWEDGNFEDGWFGGMIDGEGTFRFNKSHKGAEVTVCQIPGDVFDSLISYAKSRGYTFGIARDGRRNSDGNTTKFGNRPTDRIEFSRMNEIFRLLGQTRPKKHIGKYWWEGKDLPGKKSGIGWMRIISIEKLEKQEMIDLQTSDKTFIMEGFVSHNSTLVEAILYAYTSQGEATNSLVVADDIDGANYLFGMQKLYQEMLSEHLRPQIKHSNEKKLEFEAIHSQVLIDTSDNLSAGRKFTFRFIHLSEVSRFRNLRELMLGINQSVPNLPGTMVIGETTANGMNQFYDEWVKCENGKKDGLTDWETFFITWFEIEEYTMPLVGGNLYPVDGISFVTPSDRDNFLMDEKVLKEKFGLTDEQVNWRRWCIVNNCNGSVLEFCQEFPSSWEESFLATGDLFFDKQALGKQEIVKPAAVGHIVKDGMKYVFREDGAGLFKVYEYPKRGEQYVVAGDPAEGLEHGDKSAGIVLNKRTNKTACVYNHNIPPDRFEADLIKLGHFYNEAVVACENKGYGYSVNQGLYKNYGRVYRKVNTKTGIKDQTLELGFNTNRVTRPSMLAQLAEEIYDGSTDLLDRDLIQQCWTFINNAKRGQPEADKGKADDIVMARCIAGAVRNEQPFKEKFIPHRRVSRFKGLSGY